MSVETIERVALAIEQGIADLDLGGPGPLDYSSIARAAIEAMRDPTEAQIRAVDAACHQHWPSARKMAIAMQYALIDAALSPDSLTVGLPKAQKTL